MKKLLLPVALFLFIVSACAPASTPLPAAPTSTLIPATATVAPTATPNVVVGTPVAPDNTPTPLPPDPADWKSWPVIPALNGQMLDVYAQGQSLGRDAHVVSVVGDCESSAVWFLKDFSKGERYYNLGPYTGLQATIDYFNPSLGYSSYAAIRGATASTVLAPLWADRTVCNASESPLACEYRLRNPSFAFIALGTNDIHKPEKFEPNMRAIIEYTLEQGIVPILVTKADNLEGDESINLSIARLAVEYNLPVWNFWAAVQPLPGNGLQEDGAHLTYAPNFFDDPEKLERAWPVRNLTALQVLESMRLAVEDK